MEHFTALAPRKQYPSQIIEAAQCYNYLTKDLGIQKILIAGDSAGGNLGIALLAHLHHGHPGLALETSIVLPSAMVLMSPWVEIRAPPTTSMYAYAKEDCVTWSSLDAWGKQYCPDIKTCRAEWVSPGQAGSAFWLAPSTPRVSDTGLLLEKNYSEEGNGSLLVKKSIVPKSTLVLFGTAEVMRDDIRAWCRVAGIPLENVVEEQHMGHGSVISQLNWQSQDEWKANRSFGSIVHCLGNAISDGH